MNQVVRYFLTQKIRVTGEISHQELLAYYRDHESDYAFKAKAKWEQVMVRKDKFPTKTKATAAIVEMGNKIVYGAALAGIAKKSSQGYRAADGGQHDWTTKGSLVLKELDTAIFTLPVGQLSDVIETKQGFHIIRVLERRDAGKVEFLEAQVEIRKKLESERQTAAFTSHLDQLKDSIPVEIIGEEAAPTRTADKAAAGSGSVIR